MNPLFCPKRQLGPTIFNPNGGTAGLKEKVNAWISLNMSSALHFLEETLTETATTDV